MALETKWIRFGDGGRRAGYYAVEQRAAAPLPAVLVLQEAWGVDAHIEDVTRRFAEAGYAALAPDLFAPDGERPPALARERLVELQGFMNAGPKVWSDPAFREAELAKRPEDERARINESLSVMMGNVMNQDTHLPVLLDAARFLRAENPATKGQKLGSVGFCMGGGLSALLACNDPELAAAVIFYGRSPSAELVPRVACPILGFYGGEDPNINAGVPPFADAMAKAGKRFEQHTFPGVYHAFFNDNRPTYNVAAARAAFSRTLAFFAAELTS